MAVLWKACAFLCLSWVGMPSKKCLKSTWVESTTLCHGNTAFGPITSLQSKIIYTLKFRRLLTKQFGKIFTPKKRKYNRVFAKQSTGVQLLYFERQLLYASNNSTQWYCYYCNFTNIILKSLQKLWGSSVCRSKDINSWAKDESWQIRL